MVKATEVGEVATPCFVVHPNVTTTNRATRDADSDLAEAVGLAGAIDLQIIHAEVINLAKPRPSAFLGKGSIERLNQMVSTYAEQKGNKAIVIMDCTLSPVQQRNLERGLNCKVIDRTGLILEIFGVRARTKEGRLQVDLAALTYQRSRLVRSWTHLERQRGGAGFMGGPGERQIEIDRRLIDQRIDRIKRELKDVRRTRDLHRKARKKVPYSVIALVGYTNAGKSTFFNLLTEADVIARDQLFATLDPTMRTIDLPDGRQAVLSDTVGFVSELPHELVNAFHATLEEVNEADLIVHVRDISHPDTDVQKQDVERVLSDIGIDEESQRRMIEVLNKIDRLDPKAKSATASRAKRDNSVAIPVSAMTGEGCENFLDVLAERLAEGFEILDIKIDHADGRRLAWLYQNGEVIDREDTDAEISVKVRLSPIHAARFQQGL